MVAGKGFHQREGGASSSSTQHESNRRIEAINVIGTVVDMDEDLGLVRVQFSDLDNHKSITGWIPASANRSAHDRDNESYEIDEQVLVSCPSGRIEDATIVKSLRKNQYPLTSRNPNNFRRLFRVIENTAYWFGLHERLFDGEVIPELRRKYKAEDLKTFPPQPKKLKDPRYGSPTGKSYIVKDHIRPEEVAHYQKAAIATMPSAASTNELLSATMAVDSVAVGRIEAAVTSARSEAIVGLEAYADGSATTTHEPPPGKNGERGGGGKSVAKIISHAIKDAVHTLSVKSGITTAKSEEKIQASETSTKKIDIVGSTGVYELNVNGKTVLEIIDGVVHLKAIEKVVIETPKTEIVGDLGVTGEIKAQGKVQSCSRMEAPVFIRKPC